MQTVHEYPQHFDPRAGSGSGWFFCRPREEQTERRIEMLLRAGVQPKLGAALTVGMQK